MTLTSEDLQAISNLLDIKLEPIKEQLNALEQEVATLKQDVATLKQETSSIKLTLENQTNHSIQIIAEGHTNLTRKLDDALKVENEKEMLLIRVSILENEVRLIKDALYKSA